MAKERLYRQKGARTWYMDLRDLGAGRKTTGERDRDKALQVLARTLAGLGRPRAEREAEAYRDAVTLAHYASGHLERKAQTRRRRTVERDAWSLGLPKGIEDTAGVLRFRTEPLRTRGFISWARKRLNLETVPLTAVSGRLLDEYAVERSREGAAAQSILHELHALSSLYKRAAAEGVVAANPVRAMQDRPVVRRDEPDWLEIEEAAALLEAAEGHHALHGLIAVCLYTGARRMEALGLEAEDVDLERGTVRFRDNEWRKLKRGGTRYVPLWDGLRRILLDEADLDRPGLLFPSPDGTPWVNLRRSFGTAVEAAGIEGKAVSWVTLRHTYAATRLQTLDNGAPVSPWTVAREMGHQGLGMLERHYGHVLRAPLRREAVSYMSEAQEILDALTGPTSEEHDREFREAEPVWEAREAEELRQLAEEGP